MALEEALALQPAEPKFLGAAGVAHAMSGDRDRAEQRLAALLADTTTEPPTAETDELRMYLATALESTAMADLAAPHYRRVLEPILNGLPGQSGATGSAEQRARQRHAALRLAKLLQPEPQPEPEPEQERLWDSAVAHGLWSHRLQRPGYVVPGYTLRSAPWWAPEDLSTALEQEPSCEAPADDSGATGVGDGQRRRRYAALQEAIELMEREAEALAAEFGRNGPLT